MSTTRPAPRGGVADKVRPPLSAEQRAARSATALKYYYNLKENKPDAYQKLLTKNRANYLAANPHRKRHPPRVKQPKLPSEPRLMLSLPIVLLPICHAALESPEEYRKRLAGQLHVRQLEAEQLAAEIKRLTQQLAALPPPA